MKTVIFSDTHLTSYFEPRKFEYLVSIIDLADHVIINGDFWDSYFVTFDEFVESEWKQLFPLLKKKKAIYLYGNHDSPPFAGMDARVKLFSVKQGRRYKLKSKKLQLHIEHGDRFYPEFKPENRWMQENYYYRVYFTGLTDYIDAATHFITYRSPIGRGINRVVKRLIKDITKKDFIFVMGHSHYYEVDVENKYVNLGANRFGYGNYLVVEDGKYELVNTTY